MKPEPYEPMFLLERPSNLTDRFYLTDAQNDKNGTTQAGGKVIVRKEPTLPFPQPEKEVSSYSQAHTSSSSVNSV